MSIDALPFAPEEVRLEFNRNTRATRSPFTGRTQQQRALNEWWVGEIRLANLTDTEAAQWRAWLLSLKGRTGTFRMGPYRKNQGSPSADDPTVDGSGQTGRRLRTVGWTPNSEGNLLPGDHLEVDQYLYLVTAPVDADSSGVADVAIWPRLRTQPADGAPVIIDNPRGTFRRDDAESPWDIRPGRFTSFRIGFVEAL